MIIGETFQSGYDRYEEENYDYLFRRKAKEERQQKRTEKKEKRQEKSELRSEKKQQTQDPVSVGKRRPLLPGNFGLFDKNKNKKKNTIAASTSSASSAGTSVKKEPGDTSKPPVGHEIKLIPKTKAGAIGSAGIAAEQGKSKQSETSAGESAESETAAAELQDKEPRKTGRKKESGLGALFGLVFLGITMLIAGMAIHRVEKKSNMK